MKKKYLYVIVLLLLSITNVSQAEGFGLGTLVHTQKGLIPIEHCNVGDYIYAKQDQYVHHISHIISYISHNYIRVTISDERISVSPYQKLYVINKGWIRASDLELSDQILSCNDETIPIKKIEVIEQSQQMYALSVETNHIFCVGYCGIIVHNVEPIT